MSEFAAATRKYYFSWTYSFQILDAVTLHYEY